MSLDGLQHGEIAARARQWLKDAALPLWTKAGVDERHGGFHETLALDGTPIADPKRTLVQARQIASFRVAGGLGVLPEEKARELVRYGLEFVFARAALPDGTFARSVQSDGSPHDPNPDLYTQAFMLYAMAHAYAIDPKSELRERSLRLIDHLRAHRRAEGGGFTELRGGAVTYESNPHMHLLEAMIAWMEVDRAPIFREIADEVAGLCLSRFIDPATGFLAERFEPGWAIRRTEAGSNGRFVAEPGHQFEWAWLLFHYERLTGRSTAAERERLFALGERHGICPDRGAVYFELWSDASLKTAYSRFWTPCERVKAALRHGSPEAADSAMRALFRYLETPKPGLWWDIWESDGSFRADPSRASSFYHLMGALDEYLRVRAGL